MFRIISKGRLRKLSVHQRNRICIICGLSRCSGCSDRCGWSLLYSKWQVGGKIYSTTNYIKNRYGQKLSAYEITAKSGDGRGYDRRNHYINCEKYSIFKLIICEYCNCFRSTPYIEKKIQYYRLDISRILHRNWEPQNNSSKLQ